MPLIAESKYTSPWSGGVPYPLREKASSFNFSVPSQKLSVPYSLKDGDTIKGRILKVEDIDKNDYPGLNDKEIEFVLYSLLSGDYLFISKECWERMFREYGLVLAFYISVKLEEAIRKDGAVERLYTMKDLNA
jgi:hypothetical protein